MTIETSKNLKNHHNFELYLFCNDFLDDILNLPNKTFDQIGALLKRSLP